MKTHLEHTQGRQSVATPTAMKEPGARGRATIMDDRPSTLYQRKLREAMNASAAGKVLPVPRKVNNNVKSSAHQEVIQLRAPQNRSIGTDTLLIHGTSVEKFSKNKGLAKGSEKTTDPSKPSEPAFFSINDKDFSIQVPLFMRKKYEYLKKKKTSRLYLHKFRPVSNLDIVSWEKWRHAREDIFRKIYPDIHQEFRKNKKAVSDEDLERRAGRYAQTKRSHHHLRFNDAKAALEIKKYGKDGYEVQQDGKFRKPEVVLFQPGLNKLQSIEVDDYNVKKTSRTKISEISYTAEHFFEVTNNNSEEDKYEFKLTAGIDPSARNIEKTGD